MIRSDEETVMSTGMILAWKCKSATLVPDLLELLSFRCLRKKDIDRNNRIILALSGIADPLALPSLEKLVESKMFLHGDDVKRMKLALFHSLAAYPHNAVLPLCRKGLKSNEPEIKKSCRAILARAGKGGKP